MSNVSIELSTKIEFAGSVGSNNWFGGDVSNISDWLINFQSTLEEYNNFLNGWAPNTNMPFQRVQSSVLHPFFNNDRYTTFSFIIESTLTIDGVSETLEVFNNEIGWDKENLKAHIQKLEKLMNSQRFANFVTAIEEAPGML